MGLGVGKLNTSATNNIRYVIYIVYYSIVNSIGINIFPTGYSLFPIGYCLLAFPSWLPPGKLNRFAHVCKHCIEHWKSTMPECDNGFCAKNFQVVAGVD